MSSDWTLYQCALLVFYNDSSSKPFSVGLHGWKKKGVMTHMGGRKGKNNSSCGGYEYIIGSHLSDSEREEAQVKGWRTKWDLFI